MLSIKKNQYYISMTGYEDKIPFVPSLHIRTASFFLKNVPNEFNEMIIKCNAQKSSDEKGCFQR